MKKLLLLLPFLHGTLFATLDVAVSITPIASFTKAIGKERVNITTMVAAGSSPHSYEPKPSQMKALSKAKTYLAIDIEFEHIWLKKFQANNQALRVHDVSKRVQKSPMGSSCSACNSDDAQHIHRTGLDPHIWTNPHSVKVIAQNIFQALVSVDPQNQGYYMKNLQEFMATINKTDTHIKAILKNKKSSTFMVFHPSWGEFAKAYGLTQVAVEVEGKEPKPKELIALIKKAKTNSVNVIFVQPEFPNTAAVTIAKELNIALHNISHLAPNWSENLISFAKAIAK